MEEEGGWVLGREGVRKFRREAGDAKRRHCSPMWRRIGVLSGEGAGKDALPVARRVGVGLP